LQKYPSRGSENIKEKTSDEEQEKPLKIIMTTKKMRRQSLVKLNYLA